MIELNMSKYRSVGIANIVFGLLQTFYPASLVILIIPKVSKMYTDFDAIPPSFTIVKILTWSIMLFGIVNVYLGFRLLRKSTTNKNKYYKYAVAFLVTGILLLLTSPILGYLSLVVPIYNLTSQF